MSELEALIGAKRDAEAGLDSADLAAPMKRLKRNLTQEADIKVYEKNIHETLQSFLNLRQCRAADFDKTFTLMSRDDHARERRSKVFAYFNENINKETAFQTEQVIAIPEFACRVTRL